MENACSGLTLALAVLLAVPSVATVVEMDFDNDGVLPHQELAAKYAGSTVARYPYRGLTDEVGDGLWTLTGRSSLGDGSLLYYGDVPALAATDPTTPMSINVRLRLLSDILMSGSTPNGELYFNTRGPAGFLWMYFNHDAASGISRIGGRASNGSSMMRPLPAGKTLDEFHVLTITWDPTDTDPQPADLYVDGEWIGSTYAGIKSGWSNTNGYIEFGDGRSNDGTNPIVETDWIRFGNDLMVLIVPEPVSLTLLAGVTLVALCRRQPKRA